MPKRIDNLMTEVLLELTFLPVVEMQPRMEQVGLTCTWCGEPNEGVLRIYNKHSDFTTAIYDSLDPVTRAVTLGFAFFGAHWPQIAPELLKEVNRQWRDRKKAATSPQTSSTAN